MQWRLAVVACLVAGCARNALESPLPVHDAAVADTGSSDAGVRDTSASDVDAADAAVAKQQGCRFRENAPVEPVLALVSQGALRVIRSDRTTQDLHLFAPSPFGVHARASSGDLVARDGAFAAKVEFWDTQDSYSQELVIAHHENGTLWTGSFNDFNGPGSARDVPLLLGPDATFAFQIDGEPQAVLMPSGEVEEIGFGFSIMGPPFAGGITPVYGSEDVGAWSWLTPGAQTTRPFVTPPFDVHALENFFVYLGGEPNGDVMLMIETPTSTSSIALHPVGPSNPVPAHIFETNGDWVLIEEPDGWGSYNARTLEHHFVDAGDHPVGQRPFGNPSVDVDGALLWPMRNDAWAALFRRDPDTGEWQQLGRRLANVEGIGVQARGGSYYVYAAGHSSVFVPTTTWGPAPPGQEPELVDGSAQMLRPGASGVDAWDPTRRALSPELSRDGRCAAYWQRKDRGAALTVFDLLSGETLAVYDDEDFSQAWINHFAWVE